MSRLFFKSYWFAPFCKRVSIISQAKVSLVNNFDPLDPKNVADPKFANLSLSGLETQALVLQNANCIQALKFLYPHLVLPVAHFFVQSGWISIEEIPACPIAENFGLWNANRLQPRAIKDVLNHCQSLYMLLITKTWLLSPAHLPTSWSQYHLYGSCVAGNYRGSKGVSLLVFPSCPYAVTQIPMPNNYALAVKIGTLQLICLYLPPSMPTHEALDILSAIPLTDDTIICGDFNAHLGSVTGDYTYNPHGVALEQWLEERFLTVLNGVFSPCTPTYISFSPPPMRQTWNLSRLYEDNVRSLYVTTFVTKSAPFSLYCKTLSRIRQPYVHPLMLLLTLSMHSCMTLLVAQLVLTPLAPHIGNRFGPLHCKLQPTIEMIVTSNGVELVALTRSIGGAGTSMHTRSSVSKFRQQSICLGMLFVAQ
ncbi:hypothetical protein PHYBLDRAFT_68420 [Phycomyces blakesleeanus NRRL 1555(-)]|uniref:Endonuclease/exonuclease/phosphatase domain-containing protein n=1 Tax=Phycomyces blakesleeanus (strain ATCC 8743b / DSM 1359 / FGSC 10004 / NBRC 33097 / NRRL 1555) TaxID=763407 RepID=A0A167PJJ3_PHYB8|nr:hypothetical protein PHYBLDRAFT_68420 [Phycomyces blakesleeanus NRRL 1555(-)]OAD78078.1 hypothetical protein PHYBLDRAFT_68420 [Phycomyces blakesleeanus NRRL 1555(-)]|eukprot:XP_018296118.1 hypothetical protein PHYBLDRAFT_68420 [Phycomyces blakesleeanus NRRL 1555(-)]